MSDDPPDVVAFYRLMPTRELEDLARAFHLDRARLGDDSTAAAFIDLRLDAIRVVLAERADAAP